MGTAMRFLSPVNLPPPKGRQVLRVPRVRRLRYLTALLSAAASGQCTRADAQNAILDVVRELDATKAAALGRKEPKPPKANQLVEQCVQMASRLGLLERQGQRLTLTLWGSVVKGPDLDRPIWFSLLWTTFPHFRNVVTAVCARPQAFVLPVTRYGGHFARAVSQQGLEVDQMSFEIVRDLATELFVLNWRPIFRENGQVQVVYAAGSALTLGTSVGGSPTRCGTTPAPSSAAGDGIQYVADLPDGRAWHFTGNSADIERFEQVLWRQYLELTDRVPRFPVLYPTLRDVVCESLHIPDVHFDTSVHELLRSRRRLDIYPAEGILDYSFKTPITYKQVPPKTVSGQFMTFLKIDRRGAQGGD